MTDNVTQILVPSPQTPMIFLPPDLAYKATISKYIVVASCAILVWDILDNISRDIRLMRQYPITYPTIVYFMSRAGSLAYVLTDAVYETAPIGNCHKFEKVVAWLFPVAVSFTSLLFFFRVRAIFTTNRYVVVFFGIMWVSVLAGCLTVTHGIVGGQIGNTDYCMNISIQDYVQAAAILPIVNDTLVFIAISWRLMLNSYLENSMKDGLSALICGVHIPPFSRSLLKDGQVYYLTTVTTNLMTLIMLYMKSLPISYQTMFAVPNVMLMNIMACRVFRNTKIGTSPATTFLTTENEATGEDKFAAPPPAY